MDKAKSTVKVYYMGETKRVKSSGSFSDLMKAVIESFGKAVSDKRLYYEDEDNEIISVSSEQDLTEALESNIKGVLRLIVASNTAEAASIIQSSEVSDRNSNAMRLPTDWSELKRVESSTSDYFA